MKARVIQWVKELLAEAERQSADKINALPGMVKHFTSMWSSSRR